MARFLEEVPTLPRLLQSQGYLSFQSGKWWQNHYSRGGFTHGMTLGDEAHGGRHGDAGLEIGRRTMTLILPNPALEPGALPELYNLRADPLEQFDQATLEQRKVRRLRESLNRWWPGN